MNERLYDKQEICDYLKISRATLDRWREKGLPSIKVDRAVRFNKSDVMDWVIREGVKGE